MGSVYKTAYPLVFIHGMFGWGDNEGINSRLPYWGTTTGNLISQLNGRGCESYAASVGPISSAWDQACELYAQLTGTRVDYGKAHSQRFGHRRYGRKYATALFDGWSESKKVHLIGHSFGGITARLFTHLLAYGAPEEVEASGNEVSPLFKGGNEKLIASVTTICTPHNGTQAFEAAKKYHLLTPLKAGACLYSGLLGRSRLNGKTVDFHLEQFGISNTPTQKDSLPLTDAIKKFYGTKDCIDFDLSPAGISLFNSKVKTVPSVYYFSHAFNSVKKSKDGKHNLPFDGKFALLWATSALILKSQGKGNKDFENDGLVNVSSAGYPQGELHTTFSSEKEIESGIWNVFPVLTGDHSAPIGAFQDVDDMRNFYLDIIRRLSLTENKNAIMNT